MNTQNQNNEVENLSIIPNPHVGEPQKVTLHHFTAKQFLPAIFADGLSLGDVPTGFATGKQGVWLTADHRPGAQDWTSRSTVNKQDIRITLEVDAADPRLVKWTDWARNNVEPGMYEGLHLSGGKHSAEWFVYFGTLPWSSVSSVKNMITHQDVVISASPFSTGEIESARAFSAKAQAQLAEYIARIKAESESTSEN